MPDPRVTLKRLEIADQRWRSALSESSFAPPDVGFTSRLRTIGLAAAAEAAVLHEAAATPELQWGPVPKHDGPNSLSYELRPGGNRPGPHQRWDEYDQIIENIADAQAGTDLTAVGDAFHALAEILPRIADEIDDETAATQRQAS